MHRLYGGRLRALVLFASVPAAGCLEPPDEAPAEADLAVGVDAGADGGVACAGCAPPFVEARGEREFTGELIVRPTRGLSPDRDREARARLADRTLRHYPEVDEYVLRVADRPDGRGDAENRAAAALMRTGDYAYAVPNWRVYPTATPNDPSYPGQWHLPKIQAPQAWDVQKGSPAVVLAFTDTGVDRTHPDLAARRVPGFNAVSNLAEVNGGNLDDVQGHGTHVAGIAAAIGNNGAGVSGVGWNFKFMMVRVSDAASGSASIEDITQGARWAVDNGARVVSSSYAGVESPSLQTTGAYIKSRGGLYLYAAGNNGANLTSFDHADVIVVGATTSNNTKADFSAYGPAIDVFAPGTSILSTVRGGGYGLKNGTSMATPLANGVAGMIWSVDPTLTPAQVESMLFSNADDLGAAGNDAVFGWGLVNVRRGVNAARAVACTHDRCAEGVKLGAGCDPCVTKICEVDPFCCAQAWDDACVEEVPLVCGAQCP
jgi:thermitase